MATNNVTDMFPPTPFSQQQYDANCQARWGLKPGVSLGQLVDFSNATNIIFSNGLIDGWEVRSHALTARERKKEKKRHAY